MTVTTHKFSLSLFVSAMVSMPTVLPLTAAMVFQNLHVQIHSLGY